MKTIDTSIRLFFLATYLMLSVGGEVMHSFWHASQGDSCCAVVLPACSFCDHSHEDETTGQESTPQPGGDCEFQQSLHQPFDVEVQCASTSLESPRQQIDWFEESVGVIQPPSICRGRAPPAMLS